MVKKKEKVVFGGGEMEGGIDGSAVRGTVERSGGVTRDMTRIKRRRGKWVRREGRKTGGAI